MTDDLRALMAAAAAAWGFRPRGPFEGQEAYRAALIEHVECRDYATAHELRVGRRQSAWTDADLEAFRRHMLERRGEPRQELPPGTVLVGGVIGGEFEATEDGLLSLARTALAAFVDMRRRDPGAELPILAHVLLTTGEAWVTPVGRRDRVAVLRYLAREGPVFGYVLCADTFIHSIPAEGHPGRAMKTDALVVHVGTRDLRRMMVRPYTVRDGRAVFNDPPPPDVDKRKEGGWIDHDPYATVFVTATAPSRAQ